MTDTTARQIPDETPEARPSVFRNAPPVLVFVIATTCAILLAARFLADPRRLWSDPVHDRNAHLYSGMCLASDLSHGRLALLIRDIDAFRTWPPLHDGLLVGTALLLGRGEERWAVLPSLAAWIGSAVFAFLLARRLVVSGGTGAGLLAALFVLVSPAQRAFATDVMLESLGACLTLAALYFYVRMAQATAGAEARNERSAARCLALALSALFFLKYNYWMLVVLGLSADWIGAHRAEYGAFLHAPRTRAGGLDWIRRQVQRPVTWVLALLTGLIAVITITGGTELDLYGRHIAARSTAGLVTAAYLVFFLSLIPWYRRTGRGLLRRADRRLQALVFLHAWPIALWFLWPQRLYSVLWVGNPVANSGESPQYNLFGGYPFYWASLVRDYHIGEWSAVLVLGLAAVAAVVCLRGHLRPGATAVFWLLLLSFVLTFHHPNRKSRFLHSWFPVAWAAAGAGAACLTRRRPGHSPEYGAGFAVLTGLLAAAHLPGLTAPAHAPEGGIHPGAPSVLDVTDAFLPDLADARRPAVFSNLPIKFVANWTYLQRYGRARPLETEIRGFDPAAPDAAVAFQRWLASTPCDTVVYVDIPPGSPFYSSLPGAAGLARYGALLERQSTFAIVRRRAFPEVGCTMTVWRRAH